MVLGGGQFLMSEVPLYLEFYTDATAFESIHQHMPGLSSLSLLLSSLDLSDAKVYEP